MNNKKPRSQQQKLDVSTWLPTKKAPSSVPYPSQWKPSLSGSSGSASNSRPLRLKTSGPASPSADSSQEMASMQLWDDVLTSQLEEKFPSNGMRPSTSSQFKPVVEAKKEPLIGGTYTICGIKVEFPHKAYPSQIGVMEKVLRCLTGDQNGLLESPTGSGKSLALLCSSLAWQAREFEKLTEAKENRKRGRIASLYPDVPVADFTVEKKPRSNSGQSTFSNAADIEKLDNGFSLDYEVCNSSASEMTAGTSGFVVSDQSTTSELAVPPVYTVQDDAKVQIMFTYGQPPFTVSPVVPRKTGAAQPARCRAPKGVVFLDTTDDDESPSTSTDVFERIRSLKYPGPSSPRPQQLSDPTNFDSFMDPFEEKIPKIYFASRTHKQITQLIRELRKTSYKNLRMAILGSKDQYCIHPIVSRRPNKNEACQELLDQAGGGEEDGVSSKRQSGCEYFNGAKMKPGFSKLQKNGLQPVYDIEDLSNVGRRHIICPFFASKDLAKHAQLIFCPYSYLVDSRIRAAMEINLEGQIVIFDEGHNMEDASREASSFSLSSRDLRNAYDDMAAVIAVGSHPRKRHPGSEFTPFSQASQAMETSVIHECIQEVMEKCNKLLEWMVGQGQNIVAQGYQSGNQEFVGGDFLVHLKTIGLGPDDYHSFLHNCDLLKDDKADSGGSGEGSSFTDERETKTKKVSGMTLMTLRGLVVVLGYMYDNEQKHLGDYRFLLSKEMSRNNEYIVDAAEYRRKRNRQETSDWVYKLNFWCLNPGVAFGDFLKAKSVVLTSGTLSPISSFQSELGIQFGIKFEANHVIAMDQVWAGGISRGPRNQELRGTYQFVQTFAYQDDIGASIMHVCHIVPKGVLVFFTGYRVMDTLINRWRETGVLERIASRKAVMVEPQGGDKSVFETIMEEFYSAIRGESLHDGQDGAVMFAVCRGKISEGLDFADDNARAVVAVGIPFPNFKDKQIEMKKEYNNANAKKGLLSGSDWYDIQAFRALNQALGRCLRHRNDWGALILLDTRFTQGNPNKFVQGLSKWLRPQIRAFIDFRTAMLSLECFIQSRVALTLPKLPEITAPSVVEVPRDTLPKAPEVDENALTEKELSALFMDDESGDTSYKQNVTIDLTEGNELTEDELSSLFTSDDDFSPMKPARW